MSLSEYRTTEKRSVVTMLRFLLFILIFALTTLGLCAVFGYFLHREDSEVSSSLLKEVGAEVSREVIVILDAGHGGEDGGASSADGILEKDLNLSVTRMLADLLRASGVEVVLTRDSDRLLYDPNFDYMGRKKMLDLKERLTIAEDVAAAHLNAEVLFISIHMNSYPSESVKGLQVWYSPNSAERSERLAESVQETVARLLQPDNGRKIKKAGSNIYLLDRLEIPAVLIECGFLSCTEEAALLSSESYRRELVFAVFAAITDYISASDAGGNAIMESMVPLTP